MFGTQPFFDPTRGRRKNMFLWHPLYHFLAGLNKLGHCFYVCIFILSQIVEEIWRENWDHCPWMIHRGPPGGCSLWPSASAPRTLSELNSTAQDLSNDTNHDISWKYPSYTFDFDFLGFRYGTRYLVEQFRCGACYLAEGFCQKAFS